MLSRLTYGLAWRGRYSGKGRLVRYMSGNGGQCCAVLPEFGIVLTKPNLYWLIAAEVLGQADGIPETAVAGGEKTSQSGPNCAR